MQPRRMSPVGKPLSTACSKPRTMRRPQPVPEGVTLSFALANDAECGASRPTWKLQMFRVGCIVMMLTLSVCAKSATPPPAQANAAGHARAAIDVAAASRFAALALKCLHQEYPNHISHTLDGDADVRAPHELTPAFYGCLDWHSDVHGHWLLVRLLHVLPDAPFAAEARAALARSLTSSNIAGEVAYMKQADRASFERPYGLAWLLQLCAELRQWHDRQAQQWLVALAAARTRGRGAIEELPAEAPLSDSHRRARPDGVCAGPDLGLGARCRRWRDALRAHRCGQSLLCK